MFRSGNSSLKKTNLKNELKTEHVFLQYGTGIRYHVPFACFYNMVQALSITYHLRVFTIWYRYCASRTITLQALCITYHNIVAITSSHRAHHIE